MAWCPSEILAKEQGAEEHHAERNYNQNQLSETKDIFKAHKKGARWKKYYRSTRPLPLSCSKPIVVIQTRSPLSMSEHARAFVH